MIKTDMKSVFRQPDSEKPTTNGLRQLHVDGPSCSSYTDLARFRGGNNVSERLWRSYMTILNFTYWTLTTQRNRWSLQFNPVTDSHLGLVVLTARCEHETNNKHTISKKTFCGSESDPGSVGLLLEKVKLLTVRLTRQLNVTGRMWTNVRPSTLLQHLQHRNVKSQKSQIS